MWRTGVNWFLSTQEAKRGNGSVLIRVLFLDIWLLPEPSVLFFLRFWEVNSFISAPSECVFTLQSGSQPSSGRCVGLRLAVRLTAGVSSNHQPGATHPADSHHVCFHIPVWILADSSNKPLTSLRSCRHSRTARLLVQVCLGQRRVRSSRQASSSASFQPLALRGWEAPAAAAATGAPLNSGSETLTSGCLGCSAWLPPNFRPKTVTELQRHSEERRRSSAGERLWAAIFT